MVFIMAHFLVNGKRKLSGEIKVSGAKNASLPILAACLLTEKPCIIKNIPQIADVLRLIEMIEKLGAKVNWLGPKIVKIEARNINPKNLDYKLFSELRASILLIGPLLSRFKNVAIRHPGGCKIGARSIAPHLEAFKNFGIKIIPSGRGYVLNSSLTHSAKIVMKEFSVTATENVLMAAAVISKESVIHNAAAEPYVQELGYFLEKMGVRIKGLGTHSISVVGNKNLKGAEWEIMPDPIEMGTFAAMASALGSEILIKNFVPEFLKTELEKLKDAGVDFRIGKPYRSQTTWYQKTDLLIKKTNDKPLNALSKIHNMPYPGFAADLLPIFACLMTQAKGDTLIHDWMYEGRLRYAEELKKMGAKAVILDPHRVLISGPTPLYGAEITGFDLRAGATLIIAALVAKGQSKIHGAEQVDRGYENIEVRLQKLGADIKRINSV